MPSSAMGQDPGQREAGSENHERVRTHGKAEGASGTEKATREQGGGGEVETVSEHRHAQFMILDGVDS